jgi:hypothetical protein
MKSFILTLFCLLLCSCATDTSRKPKYPPGLDEAKVLEIARQAIASNEDWLNQVDYQKPKQNDDGTFSVRATRIPEAPGGHRFIVINKQGRVTGYFRDR